eukprot:TRINITY_DN9141_c0_g1_i3.p1 TRINITY_DN9141_c0_g1~~TRINITY_DN9141_c0_g1_i3.p1  ORF type:complete len:771 (-),score=210.66 TRINITY_DN9141_c0_g1_i3:72-2309(-)
MEHEVKGGEKDKSKKSKKSKGIRKIDVSAWDALERTTSNELADRELRLVFPVYETAMDRVGSDRQYFFGCKLCKNQGSYPFKVDDRLGRNLIKRMIRCHPDHRAAKRRKLSHLGQSSLFDSPVWANMKEQEAQRIKMHDEFSLALFCVESLHSFSEVGSFETAALRLASRVSHRPIAPVSLYTLKEKFFPSLVSYFRDRVKELSKQPVSLCVDGWMCKTAVKESYLGVTAHTLQPDGKLLHLPVGIAEIPERHTSDTFLRVLKTMLLDAGVNCENVVQIVTDNGANVVKMARLFFQRIRENGWLLSRSYWTCAAHSLQRTVLLFLKDDTIQKMVDDVRCIVCKFRFPNVLAKRHLQRVQEDAKVKPLVLLRDVDTRWNSTYIMLKRFKRIHSFVERAADELQLKIPLISQDVLDMFTSVLKPFKKATKRLSQENASSLSLTAIVITKLYTEIDCDISLEEEPVEEDKCDGDDVHDYTLPETEEFLCSVEGDEMGAEKSPLPRVSSSSSISSFLLDHVNQLKKRMANDMAVRFRHILSHRCDTTLATLYLTPSHLKEYLEYASSAVETLKTVREGARKEILRVLKRSGKSCQSQKEMIVDSLCEETQEKSTKTLSDVINAFETEHFARDDDEDYEEMTMVEMRRYEKEVKRGLQSGTPDFHSFWDEERRESFPLLTSSRASLCCCMGTSVPAERLFSTSSSMITKARNRLSPSSSSAQLYLHEAMKNVPFDEADLFEHVHMQLSEH